MHIPGEGLRVGQVGGKKNQIIGLKEDKDPEELTYITDSAASLLPSSLLGAHPHPSPLGVHLCLACISLK